MRSIHGRFLLACGLVLLGAAGCVSPYAYSPYGPGRYPGVYATPPAGTYVAPGTVPQTGPQLLNPQGTNTPQWRGTQQPGSTPDSQSDAPLFDPNKDSATESKTNQPVPRYGDPNDLEAPPSGNPDRFDENQQTPFKESSGAGIHLEGIDDSASTAGNPKSTDQANPFKEPVAVAPASATRELANADRSAPDPYDYDRQNYRWLRGKVDYDEQDNSWQIIYNLKPEADDEFGGAITLVDDEKLNTLRDNDVVLVEGRVDADSRDASGKPRYRADHLARLVPRDK